MFKERQIHFGQFDLVWTNCYRANQPDTGLGTEKRWRNNTTTTTSLFQIKYSLQSLCPQNSAGIMTHSEHTEKQGKEKG